jgi:hypothetical protein
MEKETVAQIERLQKERKDIRDKVDETEIRIQITHDEDDKERRRIKIEQFEIRIKEITEEIKKIMDGKE